MKNNIGFFDSMFLYKNSDKDKWVLLKKIYDNYINFNNYNEVRIPKIIHQIWLGGDLPEKYKKLQQTWRKFHPDWEYYLWTDKNIKDVELINQEIFDNTKNLGAKSDILRYELLYKFGGLYADCDFECLKSFDDLHCYADFYAGLLSQEKPCIMNSLIGCRKNSLIIGNLIKNLKLTVGHDVDEIFNYTGPLFLTNIFFNTIADNNENNLILPSSYFYPSPNSNSGIDDKDQLKYVKNESLAVHYWHLSWIKKKKFLKTFKIIIKMILPYGIVKKITK